MRLILFQILADFLYCFVFIRLPGRKVEPIAQRYAEPEIVYHIAFLEIDPIPQGVPAG